MNKTLRYALVLFAVCLQPLAVNAAEDRVMELDGATNFRDIGNYQTIDGKTVKPGIIYRSAKLSELSDNDLKTVAALNIQTIADLRTTQERTQEPDRWVSDAPVNIIKTEYDFGDIIAKHFKPDLTGDQAEAMMANLYRTMPDQQQHNYSEMFRALAHDDGALLIHCSAGKDRTGIASALVLTALGVPEETVMKDYLKSREFIKAIQQQSHSAKKEQGAEKSTDQSMELFKKLSPEAINAFMDVRPVYLHAAFAAMKEKYGSVEGYITEGLGISKADLIAMRARLLE
jgi:protein-tyrosine phosphatase